MGMNGRRPPRRVVKFLAVVWSIGAGFLILQELSMRVSDFRFGHFAPAEMVLPKQSPEGAAHCQEVLKTVAIGGNQGPGSASKYRAWSLGYRFGAADSASDAAKLLADARMLAHDLGVPEVALPRGHMAYAIRDFTVSLEEDPQCVSAALAKRYSPQHANFFKFGAAVGLAASAGAGAVLEPQIRIYGGTASVPPALWQPLLDKQAAVQRVANGIDSYIRTLD